MAQHAKSGRRSLRLLITLALVVAMMGAALPAQAYKTCANYTHTHGTWIVYTVDQTIQVAAGVEARHWVWMHWPFGWFDGGWITCVG